MPSQIVVYNESSLTDVMAWRIAWTLNWQLRHHVGPKWNVSIGATFLPRGVEIPHGVAVLHLLNKSAEEGTLGYHDEDGHEVPFAEVFVQTAKEDGYEPSEVASHEACELALNPHVDLLVMSDSNRLYPHELCDPCEGKPYGIGMPGNQLQAADFVLPSWFDAKTPADEATSWTMGLKGPFSVAPKGYLSYLDLTNVAAGWQQTFGAERTALPPWASRLPRLRV